MVHRLIKLGLAISFAGTAAAQEFPLSGPPSDVPQSDSPFVPECVDEVVFERLPVDGMNTYILSMSDVCVPLEIEVADRVEFEAGSVVTSLEWWGVFVCGPRLPVDGFTIRFYADEDARPGALVHETVTAGYADGYEEFPGYYLDRYCAELESSYTATSDEPLWLSIQANACLPPKWGVGLNEIARPAGEAPLYVRSDYFGFFDWTADEDAVGGQFEMAVRLLGDAVIPVVDRSWSAVKSTYAPR